MKTKNHLYFLFMEKLGREQEIEAVWEGGEVDDFFISYSIHS